MKNMETKLEINNNKVKNWGCNAREIRKVGWVYGKTEKIISIFTNYFQSYLDSWVMFATPNLDPVI